jgi:DNA replicative helicase MCM subunit Mcm2 (Cdc46/Mcm family)
MHDLKSLSIINTSKYLSYVKSFKNPSISIGAEQLMILWYLSEFCKKIYSNAGIFFLEKLIKFAQANTKLYNRDIVLVQDTLLSISILEKIFFNSNVLKNQDLPRKKSCNDEIRGNRQTNRFKLIETLKATIKINTCNSNINF